MDENVKNTISEIEKKISVLQAKKDAVIKKEKARKDKARDKWKFLFMKEYSSHVMVIFGADYEEDLLPEKLAAALGEYTKRERDSLISVAGTKETTEKETIPPKDPAPETTGKTIKDTGGECV